MAKQTLKQLLGSSDERKQVELNLNPVALQPTIRNVGNYRVAVQPTPKTTAALQLAENLKTGVGLYGQAVNIAQDKAETDVETMSEEDFDKFLEQGLDKESRNIFGYTKAYNQALAKKYYAEEMPTKLQAIAAELHKNPYQYKDPADFEQAAIAAVNEAYDEADELLGGNVFSEQANNALKSATKADFIAKQQATYLQKLPEITRKVQADVAFQAFSEIDDVANVKTTIDQQILAVTAAVGNKKEAAAIVTKAYLDNIEALAKQEGKEELAQALLDELDDTTVAGLGSQGRRKFGKDGIELFNTSANRLRIERLEDDIEKAGVAGYNAELANAKRATASLYLEIYSLIKGENGSEEAGIIRLNELRDELVNNKSIRIGDTVYDGSIETKEILAFIDGATSNPDLFIYNGKLSFIQQNTGQKDAPIRQLLSYENLVSKVGIENANLLGKPDFDELGRRTFAPSAQGLQIISEFDSELNRLKFALYDKNASLPESEQIERFNDEYVEAVAIPMQKWLDTRLESLTPEATAVQTQAADAGLNPEEKQAFDAIATNPALTPEEVQASQEEYLALKRAREEAEVFITGDDGSRELKTRGGLRKIDPAIPYKKALDSGYFKDSEEQSRALDLVNNTFTSRRGVNQAPKNSLIHSYNSKVNFPNEDTVLQRSEKNANVRESLALYGVSLDELANDSYATIDPNYNRRGGLNTPIMLSGVYGAQGPFLSTPILIDGSITNTINLVEAYFSDKDNAFIPEEAQKAAAVYGMTVDVMLGQIRTYLTTNNFISK